MKDHRGHLRYPEQWGVCTLDHRKSNLEWPGLTGQTLTQGEFWKLKDVFFSDSNRICRNMWKSRWQCWCQTNSSLAGQILLPSESLACKTRVCVWHQRCYRDFHISTYAIGLRKRNPLTFSTLMLHHSKFDSGKQNLLRFMQCITPKWLVGGMAHVQFLSISFPSLTAAWLYMSCCVGNSWRQTYITILLCFEV